jgi:hypothetical protein
MRAEHVTTLQPRRRAPRPRHVRQSHFPTIILTICAHGLIVIAFRLARVVLFCLKGAREHGAQAVPAQGFYAARRNSLATHRGAVIHCDHVCFLDTLIFISHYGRERCGALSVGVRLAWADPRIAGQRQSDAVRPKHKAQLCVPTRSLHVLHDFLSFYVLLRCVGPSEGGCASACGIVCQSVSS